MSRVGHAQMKKLLDLLSADGVLVDGRVMYTNTNKQNFWRRIAVQLNAVEGGVYKNAWKWCKMWADWKNKTKKKANIVFSRKSCNNHDQSQPTLTELEIRLLKLINYPFNEKNYNMGLEMVVSKEEAPEPTDDFQVEFLNEEFGNGDMHSKDQSNSEEEDEDDKVTNSCDRVTTVTSKFCDVDDNSQDSNKLEDQDQDEDEEEEESSDYDQKISIKDSEKIFKKRKVSLEEYKVRMTLKIEKERVQQKGEELRLRALELKLKGEELRLKEIEMNKINYLTGIEEEKLKCFREISSSLRELSERTRSTSLRYHNAL